MRFLGRGGDGCQYERAGARKGTLMRHFLQLAAAPGTLSGSVPMRPAIAQLVARTGAAQRFAPTDRGAVIGAVLITVVTVATNTHLLCAAPTCV